MKKQFISWLCILALLLALAPTAVFAQDASTTGSDTSTESTDTDDDSDDDDSDDDDSDDDDSDDDSEDDDSDDDESEDDESEDDESEDDDSDDDYSDDDDSDDDDSDDDDSDDQRAPRPAISNLDYRTLTLRVVWGDLEDNIEAGSEDTSVCDGEIKADTRILVRDILRFENNDSLENRYGKEIKFDSMIGPGVDGLIIQVLAKEGEDLEFKSECIGDHEFSFDELKDDAVLTASEGDLSIEIKLLKENQSLKQLLTPGARIRAKKLKFRDTRDQWFTDFVEFASEQGIIEGFKDKNGKATGEFGPSNYVRITELAKIANKIAGYEEAEDSEEESELSLEEKFSWAKGHFLRWKKLGITVPTVEPSRYATRGEVFQAIYEAIIGTENFEAATCDVSALTYSDLDPNHENAKAACLMTIEGIVSGTDSGEIQLDSFVRRAEIAKITHNALKLLGADDDLEDEYEDELPEDDE